MENKWKQFNLLEVASIAEKRVSDFEGERDYVATRDIDFNRIVSAERVAYKNRASRADLLMTQNDVLFAKMKGTIKVLVGSKAVEDKIFSTGFYILSPEKDISKDFLYFFFLTDSFNKQKDSLCTGATMSGLNNSGLKRIKIPIPVDKNGNPDLTEQKRIVTILEEAEVLKKKRAEADKKMGVFVPALFSKLFGNQDWESLPISDIAAVKIGPFGTQLHAKDYIEDGIPLINPTHIVEGKIKTNNRLTISISKAKTLPQYVVRAGDVVLGRRGEMGRCAMVTELEDGYMCGTGSLFLTPDTKKINPVYLQKMLSSEGTKKVLEENAKGITMKNLNITIVNKIKIPLPPLVLQNQFAEVVKEVEKQKEKQKQSAGKLDKVFQSLLSRHLSR